MQACSGEKPEAPQVLGAAAKKETRIWVEKKEGACQSQAPQEDELGAKHVSAEELHKCQVIIAFFLHAWPRFPGVDFLTDLAGAPEGELPLQEDLGVQLLLIVEQIQLQST
mmetsp:Transcript_1693/g.2164  ORF Transcript_1693/g.2164 Transcript_1693/m.2164 type:complete len:111 (+) Transcript_1693:1508-1840(+)